MAFLVLQARPEVTTVIVTRPAPEAQTWVDAMTTQGIQAFALPLIDIRPAAHADAVRTALRQLAGTPEPQFQAVMFVSAAAVNHFLIANNAYPDCRNSLKSFQTSKCRAWATGQGTVRALLAAGVPEDQIDSPALSSLQWDSESLWAQVSPRLSDIHQVLIVRGADAQGQLQGRDWLAKQLEAKGIAVQQVAAYERHLPVWTTEQQATAVKAAQGGLWVFSASEAIANLQQLVSTKTTGMPDVSLHTARALTTHARIAQSAKAAGFGVVYESLPGLVQVMASIKSLQ
jgi:uroporphyrinogen-III synthase